MISEANYVGNLGFIEFARFQKIASQEQKNLFKKLLSEKNYVALKKLLNVVLGTDLHDSFYKGNIKESQARFIIIPLGLSFDELIHAAIVATKPENRGNKVIDRQTNSEINKKQLLAEIRKHNITKTEQSYDQSSLF